MSMDNLEKYAVFKKRMKKVIRNKGLRRKVLEAVRDIFMIIPVNTDDEDIDTTQHDDHGRVSLEDDG